MSEPSPSRNLVGRAVLRDALVQELLAAPLVAVLATFDRAEIIHAVPMWFTADEGAVLLATGSSSRKVQNLEHDPRATLVIHDSRPGFEVCGVSIAGTVEVVSGAGARPLVDRVHDRYVTDIADKVVRSFLDSDDVALRLHPESAITWDERESAASERLRDAGGALPLLPTEPRG